MNMRTKKANSDTKAQAGHIPDSSLFVRVSVVAHAIGFTPRTVRRMLEDGELPGRKFGSEWRMHREDFEKLMKPQLTEAA